MTAAKKVPLMSEQYLQNVDIKLRKQLDWNKIIVTHNLNPSEVISQSLDLGYQHVCQDNHNYFLQDLNTSASMLSNKKQFFEMPLSTIFSPQETSQSTEAMYKILDFDFNEAKQKSSILAQIEATLKARTLPSSLITDIVISADELFTNAIFNAPFVDFENTSSGAQRSNNSVNFSIERSAKLFIGIDKTRLVIGCKDLFGTLNLLKLFKRIKSCYDTGVADNINMSSCGGAGIGSFLVFNYCSSYYAAVTEGESTLICCALPLKMTGRARAIAPKNLHFIID